MNEIINKLNDILPVSQIKMKEPMKNHTTFKVGGPATLFVSPQTQDMLQKTLAVCKASKENFFIIGNGSNLIVRDDGYDGVIISTKELKQIEADGLLLRAESGISLRALADFALSKELSGLEFASGIPGSLGGAVTMNAGAYDGEMKQVIERITVITEDGCLKTLSLAQCELGYRSSIFQKKNWVIVDVELKLVPGVYANIKEKMLDFNQQRRQKQPLEYPSAGSTFRRPEGHFAGKLIQDAGFKGYCIGGAQVSEKHSGFVINKDGATTADILKLIEVVQAGVKEQFDVDLETEVIVIGKETV